MAMDIDLHPPLGGPPPDEVALARAPLARVIAQVRFPAALIIETKERVAPFQDELRAIYPVFKQESGQNIQVEMSPNGPSFQTSVTTLWRFSDFASDWTVTLAIDAITLETRRYVSRDDFLDRLSVILSAVQRAFAPGVSVRLGMRYVTRVTGEGYARVEAMVSPGLLGVAVPALRNNVRHAISEASLSVEEGDLLMKWGIMPPNGSFDPSVLEPLPEESWVLDVDVSSSTQMAFQYATLTDRFHALARRAYSMFRYMVTDQFLILYGGHI